MSETLSPYCSTASALRYNSMILKVLHNLTKFIKNKQKGDKEYTLHKHTQPYVNCSYVFDVSGCVCVCERGCERMLGFIITKNNWVICINKQKNELLNMNINIYKKCICNSLFIHWPSFQRPKTWLYTLSVVKATKIVSHYRWRSSTT